MLLIQQSDTTHPIDILMTSSTDHVSPLTGATVTVTLSKNGGVFAAAAGTVAEIGSGIYKLTPTSADTGTLGELAIHATATGGDPADLLRQIVAFNPYDVVHLGLSSLPNAAANAAGGLPISIAGGLDLDEMNTDIEAIQAGVVVGGYASGEDPASLVLVTPANKLSTDASGRVTVGSIVNSAIAAATFGANALGAVWDELRASHTTGGTFGQGAASVQGNVTGSVASVAGAVGSVTAAVTVGTNNDKTGYGLSAAEDTAIVADVQTALTAQGYTAGRAVFLDTLNGLVAAIWANATRSLTTLAATGNATDLATAIWNAVAASYNTANSLGAKLNSAASAGDPWTATLPGGYGAGTAGNIVGNNLNATVTSRQPSGNVTVGGYATGQDPAALVLDAAAGIETGVTVRQAIRQSVRILAAKLSGGGSSAIVVRNLADTKNALTATVDANGNRTTVTNDFT